MFCPGHAHKDTVVCTIVVLQAKCACRINKKLFSQPLSILLVTKIFVLLLRLHEVSVGKGSKWTVRLIFFVSLI